MKKVKVIGASVAALGIALSVGGALALYTRAVDPVQFGFSAETYTGATEFYDYTLTQKQALRYTDASGNTISDVGGISPTVKQINVEYSLGATYNADVAAQDYVVGNLKVDVTNINEALQGKIKVYIGLNGYVANTVGEDLYKNAFGSEVLVSESSYSANHDIAVMTAGDISVTVWVKLQDNVEGGIDYTLLDEGKAFDLAFTWDVATHFNYANVTGALVGWDTLEEYRMVPNLNKAKAEGFEWMFSNLSGEMAISKCRLGDVWSTGDDAQLDPAKTYTVYWAGEGSQAYYSAN